MSGVRLKDLLESLPGSLSEWEALALFRVARTASGGAVVKIGPCNEKATVALVVGLASHPPGSRQNYYCIEPNGHVNGSRSALMQTLTKMGCGGLADLIVAPGAAEIAAWREPVSALYLPAADYTTMRAQVDRWLPFLTPNACIVIQGPVADKAARRRLVSDLEANGDFIRLESTASLVELRRAGARKITLPANSSAAEVVQRYASVHGFDEASLNARLAHSSFVSRRYRFAYVEIPKAACTAIKYFIAELENAPLELGRIPYLRETKQSMLIHQRQYVGVPTLLHLAGSEIHALLSGTSDYFTFALVRNPYSRLVSAFESKIRLGEPGMREVFGRRWAAAMPGADVREAFAAFVRHDLEGLISSSMEHHFVSQHRLLMRPIIPYTKIFQVERFKEFETAFFAHLRGQGAETLPKFKDWNRSSYPDWRFYYDEPTAERVFEFFEPDFDSYGYDPESWRTTGKAPELRTSEEEAYWRTEVIERNEMIDFLYGLLYNPR
ncbi:MAG TPA: sulfotransferase family 2 domain-containing protein [Micropepsaceae bacterium]|nr:sulfotransferase family 2 domain-containing protein [Micropepsaceae bacterium]